MEEHEGEETDGLGGVAVMMMAPEQGALTTLLVRAIGARRALEIGTFTGYGAISIGRGALSMPWIFRDTWSYLTTGIIPDPPTTPIIRSPFG